MEGDVWQLIKRLTPAKPFSDSLDKDMLRELSKMLRHKPENQRIFFQCLQRRSAANSSQVRFLCLRLTHYVFCRGAHFRSEFCRSAMLPFIDLFSSNLPPPVSFARRIKEIIYHVVSQWAERFGDSYKQLRILAREFEPPSTDAKKDIRIEGIGLLTEMLEARSKRILDELDRLIQLLVPEAGRFASDLYTEEYKLIVLENMRERRGPLRDLSEEIDRLTVFASRYGCEDLLMRIKAVNDRVSSIEQQAIDLGMDDDEFVDVESSSGETS
jgi:hypothetical protein